MGGSNFLAKLAQVDKFSTKEFFSNFLNSLTILLPKNPDDLFFSHFRVQMCQKTIQNTYARNLGVIKKLLGGTKP